MYMYIFTRMNICTYTYTYTYKYIYNYVNIYICIRVCMYAHRCRALFKAF